MRVCAIAIVLCLLIAANVGAELACYQEKINSSETTRVTRLWQDNDLNTWENTGPGDSAFGQISDSITYVHSIMDISPPLLPDGTIKLARLKLWLRTRCHRDLTLIVDNYTYDQVRRRQILVRPEWGEWINVNETILGDGIIEVTLIANAESECDWDDGDITSFDVGGSISDVFFEPYADLEDTDARRSREQADLALCPSPKRGMFVLYVSALDVVYRQAIPLAVDDVPVALPAEPMLSSNYPNPFNPETTIEYQLPSRAHVRVDVMNVLGQTIRLLTDEVKPAGAHRVVWNGRNEDGRSVASGVYYYRITAGDFINSRKMILLK